MLSLLIAGAASLETQLIALDRRIQVAMVANQSSFLRSAIAADFCFTHADGLTESKADVIRTAARTPRYYLRRDVLKARAEVHGKLALVFGSLDVASGPTPTDPPDAKPVCYALNYIHVFVKRQDRWQLRSHRTTKMIKPQGLCAPAS